MKRIGIILFTLLLLVPPLLASCGESTGKADLQPADTTIREQNQTLVTEAVTTYGRSNMPDNLPDTLDFDGGTVTLYYRDHKITHDCQMEGENNGGDVLYDAVWNRNRTVEDRLNINLAFKVGPADDTLFRLLRDAALKEIMAGDCDWDCVFLSAQFGFEQMLAGCYIDLIDFPYLDYDQPWWWNEYMEEESIETSHRYMLNGDLTLYALMSATAGYYNKNMFADLYGDTEQLYAAVEDGLWTFERFMDYCAGAYRDLNGDGQRDTGDVYGVWHSSIWNAINYPTLSCGLLMSYRDADGLPVLDLYNENWIRWSEILTAYMTDTYSRISPDEKSMSNHDYFISQRSLFSMDMLFSAGKYRDTDFDYGIVPYPKFDEAHDYLSAGATPNADAIFVPVTLDPARYEILGAALEALCAESYRSVTETYYETTLKNKYLENRRDLEMVDVIYQHINTFFIMVAKPAGGAISSSFVYTVQDYGGNFSSYYESKRSSFEEYMKIMLDKYAALEK